ncbi:MAG: hypothetical protein ACUVTE_05610 [Candidatus Bathycorpusculaceae bacterium]
MDISIRMIGIASTFFWIILLAFFASAAYYVKDLHLSIGEPILSVASNGDLLVSVSLNIENEGYYDLGAFNLTTKVADVNGSMLAEGCTFLPKVKRGVTVATFHNLTLHFNDLLEEGAYYMFNDANLSLAAIISMNIAEVIPVKASSNFSVPWGAPFYNFQLGEPTFKPFNLTHLEIAVPISFENHAFFDVYGKIRLRMYNSEGSFIGLGETDLEAPQGFLYNGFIVFFVQTAGITRQGFFEVYFSTSLFEYGPLVIPYG